ncbi:hypothetical protein BV22DRAFT_813074 [Leucogyrophana mollusca]|uniref:Uncharacterized protein n=1 Tax=Leucogyrophana mollusca TaxID=85980 RepID=A0ACB8B3A6_9AGAM|nr:hypothetical protein BV22DRAFT_813074 [Leucogyrophana mollusca]
MPSPPTPVVRPSRATWINLCLTWLTGTWSSGSCPIKCLSQAGRCCGGKCRLCTLLQPRFMLLRRRLEFIESYMNLVYSTSSHRSFKVKGGN